MLVQRSIARSTGSLRIIPHLRHQAQRRRQSTHDSETIERSPAKLYRPYIRPFAKVFLGAMFTYQVLYWAWEKLRLDELREQKLAEMKELEAQVEEYKQRQRMEKERGVGNGGQSGQGTTNEKQGKNRSWFSW